jgi:hypothetical protein
MAKEHEVVKSPERRPFETRVEDAPDVKEEDRLPMSDKTKAEMQAGREAQQYQESLAKQSAAIAAKEEAKAAKEEKE